MLVSTKMGRRYLDGFSQVAFSSHQNSKYFGAMLVVVTNLAALCWSMAPRYLIGHGCTCPDVVLSSIWPYLPNDWLMGPLAVAPRLKSGPGPNASARRVNKQNKNPKPLFLKDLRNAWLLLVLTHHCSHPICSCSGTWNPWLTGEGNIRHQKALPIVCDNNNFLMNLFKILLSAHLCHLTAKW